MAHGRRIAGRAEEIWNWSGAAGRSRWERRVRFIRDSLPRGCHVLEVGCGTGLLTEALAEAGFDVLALDVSPDLLARAAARTSRFPNVMVSVQDACSTALKAASVDAVVGISVLHHLELARALVEFRRVLRPGGRLLFSEPNMANPIILAQKNIPWLKRLVGDSPDETAFLRSQVTRALRSAGFEPRRVEPFDFLHPATPDVLVGLIERLSRGLERVPVLREIGGSLLIDAALAPAPTTA
jgi:SAM-dependent methyltransferase